MAAAEAESKPVRFGGMTASEAGKKGAEARKRTLEQRAEAARAAARSPLDALRTMMAQSPEKYAAGLASLVEKGDPRAYALIQQLFREQTEVKIPRAERLVRGLDRAQRRALLLALEDKGLAQYLPADLDPAPAVEEGDERLAGD